MTFITVDRETGEPIPGDWPQGEGVAQAAMRAHHTRTGRAAELVRVLPTDQDVTSALERASAERSN